MRTNYGVPYKGSKNFIAPWIINMIPSADTFYDLFAGGCAVTHCAMSSGKWKNFVCNDIDGDGVKLFIDAINGKFRNERRWISRDDFFRLKDDEPYVKFCWSFGNDGKSYIYGRDIERIKKKMHDYSFGDDSIFPDVVTNSKEPRERMLLLKRHLHQSNSDDDLGKGLERLQSLDSLQSLESLERLESLESLESLERLESYRADYRDVDIKEGSVIYCDIPYKGTNGYFNGFDYDCFYTWAHGKKEPVYISEYFMPDNFHLISSVNKTCRMSATKAKKTVENLYANDSGFELFNAGRLL